MVTNPFSFREVLNFVFDVSMFDDGFSFNRSCYLAGNSNKFLLDIVSVPNLSSIPSAICFPYQSILIDADGLFISTVIQLYHQKDIGYS